MIRIIDPGHQRYLCAHNARLNRHPGWPCGHGWGDKDDINDRRFYELPTADIPTTDRVFDSALVDHRNKSSISSRKLML